MTALLRGQKNAGAAPKRDTRVATWRWRAMGWPHCPIGTRSALRSARRCRRELLRRRAKERTLGALPGHGGTGIAGTPEPVQVEPGTGEVWGATVPYAFRSTRIRPCGMRFEAGYEGQK